MANIMFKRGLQANLPQKAVDGSFYLTEDTQRLYVGIGENNAPVELNRTIRSVESLTALNALRGPVGSNANNGVAVGDFYYVAGGANSVSGNILAYCSAVDATGKPTWIQINPDTNTKLATSTDAVTKTAVGSGVTSGVKVATSVKDTEGRTASGDFQIVGSENITVALVNGQIKISTPDGSDTHYQIKTQANSSKGTILLDSSGTDDSSINISGGKDSDVRVTSDDDGNITIGVTDMRTKSIAVDAKPTSGNGFDLKVDGRDVGDFDPTIKLGDNEAIHFVNGNATLPVYTKTEVDTKVSNSLKTFDAMAYKGTVSKSDASTKLASTGNVGDTYKAAGDITDPVTANTGDLIIATGTDGAVTWDVIPSGDDQTITGAATTSGISVSDQSGTLAEISVVKGSNINVSNSTSGKKTTLTVGHEAITQPTPVAGTAVTQTAKNNAEFTAITDITEDGYGHVTGITTKKLTVVDTHNDVSGVETLVRGSNNVVTTDISVSTKDGTTKTGNFSIGAAADSIIKVTGSGSATTLALEWGSF